MSRRFNVAVVVAAGVLITLPLVLSAQTNEARFLGRPEFSEGNALGYFIWKEDDKWKLRWTTFGSNHRFSGRIVVEGGDIRDFKRIDVDTERKVLVPGRRPRVVRGPRGRVIGTTGGRAPVVAEKKEDHIHQESERLIVFNTETNDDMDGADFRVTNSATALRLFLEIDGKPRPDEVEAGKGNFKPNEHPVVIRLR